MQSNNLIRAFRQTALLAVILLCFPFAVGALGQAAEVSQTASASSKAAAVIPQQVRYAGMMPNRGGDTVQAVFSIYASAEGGEALWTETQVVPVSPDGSYTVMLGSASESGLPQSVFAAGQARWLAVSLDRAERGPRTPLASVAYAMKAGDAETVGGVAVANLATKEDLAKLSQTVTTVVQAQPQVQIQPETAPSGTGTTDYVPLWTGSATLGNSNLYQATSGFMGIGTTTPGGPLELDTNATGGANATMMLRQTNAASGNYYADIGLYNSNGLIGNLSALGAGYPTGQLFGPNDVVFLGGQQKSTTNLIFVTNTSGALKFGTGGYGTGNERMRVGATGGLSLGNSYVGTDPGAGNFILSGKLGVGTTTPAAVLEVNGTAKFDGLVTFASGQTFPGGGGSGTITGITTTSPLTGSGTSGSVALGFNTTALETTLNGVYAQLGAADTFTTAATFSNGATFSGGITSTTNGANHVAVTGTGTGGAAGVSGISDTAAGITGKSTSGYGVLGSSTSGAGGAFITSAENSEAVLAISSVNFTPGGSTPVALYADASGTNSIGAYGQGAYIGVEGSSSTDNSIGVDGTSTGDEGLGLSGYVTGQGSYAVYGYATGQGDESGVRDASAGVYGIAEYGIGVEGFAGGQSGTYNNYENEYQTQFTGGVWGDTSYTESTNRVLGSVVGTADDNIAGFFANNGAEETTLEVVNLSNGPTGLFKTFKASTAAGTCGIGDGNLSCTGQLKALATTGDGTRTVETYATQSAENWMEDYGTGTMASGVGVVQIDPAFAEMVTADTSYHVFLTPLGDSKGLYVVKSGPNSFEVRESGGGTASIGFDYKIVAKRRGFELQRLVDVTERFNLQQAATKRRMPATTELAKAAVQSKGKINPNARQSANFGLPRALMTTLGATVQKATARPAAQK